MMQETDIWENTEAIIFDMDGVLLGTEDAMIKACIEVFAEMGYTATYEDFIPFVGMGSKEYFGGICGRCNIPFTDEVEPRMYKKYLDTIEENAEHYPGVPEKISELAERGLVIAIASSSPKEKFEANLRVSKIDLSALSAAVSGSDVPVAKPNPEIYLKAAKAINKNPANCLVFEDSLNGIKAGVAAGMRVVGVRGSYPDEDLIKAGAVSLIDSIADL